MVSFDDFDEDVDPEQYGLGGFDEDSDGLTYMRGPCLGIVLSVHYANDSDNLLYRFLSDDEQDQDNQASYIEASVVLLYGGVDMYIELDHVAILQGKCGSRGLTEGEPADWTEDIPNGCTANELDDFYANGAAGGIESLSGDWVVVDFIGGLLQTPVITDWFPSPKNMRDAATKEVGRRFLIRRNNSEIQIDKNGDFSFTHRVGQYIQMRGETITIKHRKGQIIHLDENGEVKIQDGFGNQIKSGELGWLLNSEGCAVELLDGNINVYSLGAEGKMNLIGKKVNIIGNTVYASGGGQSAAIGGGIKSVVTETLIPTFQEDVNQMSALVTILGTMAKSLATSVDPVTKAAAVALTTALVDFTKTRVTTVAAANNANSNMITKVFKGE